MGVVLFSAWIYSRRELPIAGRGGLTVLRAATLAIVVLLLWNPRLPFGGQGAGSGVPWLVIDASPSMDAQDSAGRTAAQAASELNVGADPFVLRTTDLAAAVRRAGEAGATEVTLASDLRLPDPARLRRALAESPVPVRIEDLGEPLVNAGIAEFTADVRAESDSLVLDVSTYGEGVGEYEVQVLSDGRPVASSTVGSPGAGLLARTTVVLAAPDTSGVLSYEARVSATGDRFAPDDTRTALVEIDPEAGGLVMVSLTSDWEPRFLLPVLEQVTGLTPRGFMRLSDDRFLSVRGGAQGGAVIEGDEVRRRAAQAEMLVVHGGQSEVPDWLADAARNVSRTIVFANGAGGPGVFGLDASVGRAGEWYVESEAAPSSLSGLFEGVPWTSLPPLSRLVVLEDLPSGQTEVPLRVQFQGAGDPGPALVLTSEGTRRRALVLATGYWRWAFRPDPAREAYRRLWSAVGGWLLANEPLAAGPAVQPLERVTSVHEPSVWRAPGRAGESLRITTSREGVTVSDTTVVVSDAGGFELSAPEAGDFTFEVAGADDEVLGTGRFIRDGHSDDVRHPRAELGDVEAEATPGTATAGPGGTPLRTLPLPYLVALVLLSAEWILRRRRGLR